MEATARHDPALEHGKVEMDAIRREFYSRLTYGPRFVRHYRHRRQAGYSVGRAVRSARRRMRQPGP